MWCALLSAAIGWVWCCGLGVSVYVNRITWLHGIETRASFENIIMLGDLSGERGDGLKCEGSAVPFCSVVEPVDVKCYPDNFANLLVDGR